MKPRGDLGKAYEAVVDAFEGLVFVCSREHEVIHMNSRFIRRTGYNAVGHKCYKAIHDRNKVCPWCMDDRVFSGETVRREALSPKDDRWYYTVETPIHQPDGSVTKIVLMHDITDRKLEEEQVAGARRVLEEAYWRERRIADVLQHAMLPNVNMNVEGYEVAARYRPALDEAEVGGDFYDVFPTSDGRTALVMGDVSGKGLGAAVHTAMAKYMLRAYVREDPEPGRVLERLNKAICEFAVGDTFITIFYCLLDGQTGGITYGNAGHESPLLYSSRGQWVMPLDVTGRAAGIERSSRFARMNARLEAGDVLLIYTDGITDARTNGELFGVERLTEVLSANAALDPGELADSIFEAVSRNTGDNWRDDAAVMVVKAG